jgi:NAD-dependent deacetylase
MLQNVFVLTGAGISAESGLGTFRDPNGQGIWARFDPMKLATPEAFARGPGAVLAFYGLRRRNLMNAKPNAAHFALARAQAALAASGGSLTLVTQNIDDLHERAGSARVVHMHGELLKVRCGSCSAVRPWLEDLTVAHACADCGRSGELRPHVVWFGEMPLCMDDIARALRKADLFVAIGTSGALTRLPASSPRRALWGYAPAKSTSRPPTTRRCSTSSDTGPRARWFPRGWRKCWRSHCSRARLERGWRGHRPRQQMRAPDPYFAGAVQA